MKTTTMRNVVKALEKEGIILHRWKKAPHVRIGDSPEPCDLCGHEVPRPLLYRSYCAGVKAVCSDRPACRRRQAETEAEWVRQVLDEVVV